MILISIVTIIFETILGLIVGYLLLLTFGAFFRKARILLKEKPSTDFAILIPAHNEERLLPELLANLKKQNYPDERMAIFVVADNCSDQTATLARQMGAAVFERADPTRSGKGYALNWLLAQIKLGSNRLFDAYVIFDADTVVSPDFLRVMDARLGHAEKVIQGYYAVRNPDRSSGVALRYAALAVLHFLRPLGRGKFGGSAGLKGNGMCFQSSLYERFSWSGSVTEDIEYHMTLILSGERVAFAPDAVLEAEMPGTLKSSTTQNVRWESGRLEMAKKYIPLLLRKMEKGRLFLYFDAIMEHLIPPTALIAILLGFSLVLGGLSGMFGQGWTLFWIAVGCGAGMVVYLFSGLAMVKAPRKVWLSLLYAPFYAVWKFLLLIGILLGIRKQGWVRTQR
ncbi:MAG: glycosyltransferase family 2 protein [Chloroflexi bacterium]|nr:glycosyltransferase family 2 protein [Chloroflexota bacterium]